MAKVESPEKFWADYEKQIGEKVLSYQLGKYVSGWKEFDHIPNNTLWGLLIATSGGFRFHHFPHEGWIQALSRLSTGGDGPVERTFFIPAAGIVSAELRVQTSIFKKIFLPQSPILAIRYRDENGEEQEILAETEKKAEVLAEHIRNLIAGSQPED
jgi:hypothetical protein